MLRLDAQGNFAVAALRHGNGVPERAHARGHFRGRVDEMMRLASAKSDRSHLLVQRVPLGNENVPMAEIKAPLRDLIGDRGGLDQARADVQLIGPGALQVYGHRILGERELDQIEKTLFRRAHAQAAAPGFGRAQRKLAVSLDPAAIDRIELSVVLDKKMRWTLSSRVRAQARANAQFVLLAHGTTSTSPTISIGMFGSRKRVLGQRTWFAPRSGT